MRRPNSCCDHQSTATVETAPCKDQGGAFARMRRLFLSTPLGRRSSPLGGSQCPKQKCRHHRETSRHLDSSSLTRHHDSSISRHHDSLISPPHDSSISRPHDSSISRHHDSSSLSRHHDPSSGLHLGSSSSRQLDSPPPCDRDSTSRDLPALRLHDSFAVIQHEVLGIPLEEAVRGGNTPHGVPLLVYELCSYILNHDVSLSSLLYEEWCSVEVIATLERHPRCSALDASAVAPLLRLYLEQLPQPLLPPHTLTALMELVELGELSPPVVGDNNSVCRARRLLVRDLPPANLCLLRYLTSFLACTLHANKCSREGAWVVLGLCVVGERRGVGKPMAEYLLENCYGIFPEDRRAFPSPPCSDDAANSSDTSNPAITSQDDDSSGTAGCATTNDDEDDGDVDSSSSTSSRSSPRSTTSEGTEDFRSPQLSPTKMPGDRRYVLLSEDIIMPVDVMVMPADDDNIIIMCPEEDLVSTEDVVVTSPEAVIMSPEEDVISPEDDVSSAAADDDVIVLSSSTSSTEHHYDSLRRDYGVGVCASVGGISANGSRSVGGASESVDGDSVRAGKSDKKALENSASHRSDGSSTAAKLNNHKKKKGGSSHASAARVLSSAGTAAAGSSTNDDSGLHLQFIDDDSVSFSDTWPSSLSANNDDSDNSNLLFALPSATDDSSSTSSGCSVARPTAGHPHLASEPYHYHHQTEPQVTKYPALHDIPGPSNNKPIPAGFRPCSQNRKSLKSKPVRGGDPSSKSAIETTSKSRQESKEVPVSSVPSSKDNSKSESTIKKHASQHHSPRKDSRSSQSVEKQSPLATKSGGESCLLPHHRKRKEHVEGGPSDEHDPKISRSTNNGDLATLPLPFSSDIKSEGGLLWETREQRQELPSADEAREDPDTETGVEESDGTSCPLSDPWEDFTSAGEVYLAGVSSEDAPIPDEGDPGLGELHMGEARRWSERIYPVRSSSVDHPSPQHRSKRKKNKHRRHSKEGGAVWASNNDGETEGDKLPPSRTLSEEEDNARDATTHAPHTPATHNHRQNSLSSLLDHNEPVVACDRGRWNTEHHDDHRTALRFSRYADDDKCGTESQPWYSKYNSSGHGPKPVASGDHQTYDPLGSAAHNTPRFDPVMPSALSSNAFMKAVTGKSSSGSSSAHRNISSIKKRIKRFEEDFENKFGYKPSHSEKMKHKDIKKYMSDLSKARKELKMMKEGVADLVSSKGFSLSMLRCQESTQNHLSNPEPLDSTPAPLLSPDTKTTLVKVEERLRDSRQMDRRPQELLQMTCAEMQDEKTALQKALLYYESVHGRPNTRDARELARPLYDRYRQVKRSVSRLQARAKENINELAPIIEHVAMDFTLASPQHRSSLTPESQPVEQLMLCKEKLLAVEHNQLQQQILQPAQLLRQESDELDDDEDDDRTQENSLSDSSDVSKQSSTALSNLHSLPLHELRERRREAKDHKKKLRRSLRQFEDRYEREHGHKLAKEERGPMEQTYLDYKHSKAKLRLLEALISKKAPKEDEF